jgi:hypothetical protein
MGLTYLYDASTGWKDGCPAEMVAAGAVVFQGLLLLLGGCLSAQLHGVLAITCE